MTTDRCVHWLPVTACPECKQSAPESPAAEQQGWPEPALTVEQINRLGNEGINALEDPDCITARQAMLRLTHMALSSTRAAAERAELPEIPKARYYFAHDNSTHGVPSHVYDALRAAAEQIIAQERVEIDNLTCVNAVLKLAADGYKADKEQAERHNAKLTAALTKIFDFTTGYDDVAGIVNKIACEALKEIKNGD